MGFEIIFMGGIHGVGKSTFCNSLEKHFNVEHITASSLIKHTSVSKEIKSMEDNQAILINALKKYPCKSKTLILDGHFCLFLSSGKIENIPINTYHQINPKALFLLTLEPKKIIQRLTNRDSKKYDLELIHYFQEQEIAHAEKVKDALSVPLIKIDASDQLHNHLNDISRYF